MDLLTGDAPPLVNALWDRNFIAARALIKSGAKLDDILESDGDSFLHRAAQAGDIETVEFYLEHPCPCTLASFDYISYTPLICAAAKGHAQIVRLLIAAGADVNAHEEERIGNTAIREAVDGGHVEVVRMLLEAGADPTIAGWMGISAATQAHYTIESGLKSENGHAIRALLAKFR